MNPTEAEHIRDQVAIQGWAVFSDDRVAQEDMDAMAELANQFGKPSDRDGGPLWPITQRANTGTFSETNAEAEFHTDSQYHLEPEPYFLLFCVSPAACGGGVNTLLHLSDIKAELNEVFDEPDYLRLQAPEWSWKTPQVFVKAGAPPLVDELPVFGQGRIRWRYNNLLPADSKQDFISIKFRDYLANHPARTTLTLRAGDVLLCDNHRALHARTSFDDPNRKLYRTRLW